MAFKPGKVRFFDGKTTAPGVNDDQSYGYRVGDLWLDETNNLAYHCMDSSVGAAVWGGGFNDERYLAFDEIIQAASDTLTATECKGKQINNYGQAAANNLQALPAAAEGMSFPAVCGTAQAAHYFRFQAAASDKIYLDGVAGSDNGYVSIAVPVVGATIQFFTFQTGASAWDWAAITITGSWIAG